MRETIKISNEYLENMSKMQIASILIYMAMKISDLKRKIDKYLLACFEERVEEYQQMIVAFVFID